MEVKVIKTTIIGLPQYSISVDGVMVTLDTPGVVYEHCVDKLITAKYPSDKMQAVINNYLDDPNNTSYIEEFKTMQAWRKVAKEASKEAVNRFNSQTIASD